MLNHSVQAFIDAEIAAATADFSDCGRSSSTAP